MVYLNLFSPKSFLLNLTFILFMLLYLAFIIQKHNILSYFFNIKKSLTLCLPKTVPLDGRNGILHIFHRPWMVKGLLETCCKYVWLDFFVWSPSGLYSSFMCPIQLQHYVCLWPLGLQQLFLPNIFHLQTLAAIPAASDVPSSSVPYAESSIRKADTAVQCKGKGQWPNVKGSSQNDWTHKWNIFLYLLFLYLRCLTQTESSRPKSWKS